MPRTPIRITVITLAAAAIAAAGVPVMAEPGHSSTLAELAASALATHENIGRAQSDIRRANADVKLSKSILMPSLDLNAAYTRYADAQYFELSPGEEFELRPLSDWYWSADLRQTLFSGLRDWRARDVAKLYRDIAEIDLRTTANNLVLEVANAFFQAVASEQRVEVHQKTLEQIQSQLKVAQRRYEVGEVTVADVARWRAEVAGEKQRLVVAEGDATFARHYLSRLAGVEQLGRLTPLGQVPAPASAGDGLVEQALDTRLEMAALRHQMEAAGLMIKVEKGNWLPELNAHAQYYQQKAVFPSQDWASLAFTLRVPVYDGGMTAARVAKAREDLRQVQLLDHQVRREISNQVDSAAITLNAAEVALDAAEERDTAALEAHRQTERSYRAGEASATDLLATTAAATDAATAHIIARWQRELQAIALRHAVGLDPLPDLKMDTTVSEENES